MTEKQRELVDDIIANFNFDRVDEIFKQYRYWDDYDGHPRGGSGSKLRTIAFRVLVIAIKHKGVYQWRHFRAEYRAAQLKLEFIAETFTVHENPKDNNMPVCEKCWAEAARRAVRNPHKSQTEHYYDLLEARCDNPCSQAEQEGTSKEVNEGE